MRRTRILRPSPPSPFSGKQVFVDEACTDSQVFASLTIFRLVVPAQLFISFTLWIHGSSIVQLLILKFRVEKSRVNLCPEALYWAAGVRDNVSSLYH